MCNMTITFMLKFIVEISAKLVYYDYDAHGHFCMVNLHNILKKWIEGLTMHFLKCNMFMDNNALCMSFI